MEKERKRKQYSNRVITFLFYFFIVIIFKDHVHSPQWRIRIQSSPLSPPVAEVCAIFYQDIFYSRKLYQIADSTEWTTQPYSSDFSIQTLEKDEVSETSFCISYSLVQDHQLCSAGTATYDEVHYSFHYQVALRLPHLIVSWIPLFKQTPKHMLV